MTEMFEKRRQPPSKGQRHFVPARELEVRAVSLATLPSRAKQQTPSLAPES